MSHQAIDRNVGEFAVDEAKLRRRIGGVVQRCVRAIGVLVALATLLALAGAAYEAVGGRNDANIYPPPGRRVDVGGFRLHINCTGAGSPTVVLDAGLGATSLDWTLVQPELGTKTKVCAYDRAGMGWSDPGPQPRSPETIANELHTLLVNAGVPGPYVLVAHSLAGKSAQLFAHSHMDEMAGIVLIDARSEYVDSFTSPTEERAFVEAVENQGRLYAIARRFGIVRLFGADLAGTPSIFRGTRALMALVSTQENAIAATTAEARSRATNDAQLRTAPTLGALPLVVLASDQTIAVIPHWAEAQRRLAGLSAEGRLVIASASSHAIPWDRPRFVTDEIYKVVVAARSQSPYGTLLRTR